MVAKLDRLFRSVSDAAQTITDFDRYGIELVAISEGFDMTNPYGRAMAQMASVFAELCPHPSHVQSTGPPGKSWREWYSGAMGDGATVPVRTTDEFEYVFSMEDGRILQTIRIREPESSEETAGTLGFLGLPWWLWWILPATGLTVAGLLVALRLRRVRLSRRRAMTL